ncbi:MAG: exo-alpha-sialidase, partial [Chloroflexi bacterium]|nr:exo-alpha-sialidase [Chloroflexota bacterium]
MRVVASGVLTAPEPGTRRAVAKQVHLANLADGSVLAVYRIGAASDTVDGTAEIRRSVDGGRTWSAPETPFATSFEGRRGTIYALAVTPLGTEADGRTRLLAANLWVDRETFGPDAPIFNPETEGCLPMRILLADSADDGRTWTAWREVPVPPDVGPPSLTSPIRRLPSGRLLLSIESNKDYWSTDRWFQRVVFLYSDDEGRTWSAPRTVIQDPDGRIRNWDLRVAVAAPPDRRLVSFGWTYDSETVSYLSIRRRLSADEGLSWSQPEDLGFADQPAHPAILSDGRVVLVWVDRFGTHSIRARVAAAVDRPFPAATEAVLYQLPPAAPPPVGIEGDGGEALVAMQGWTFGLPFALTLPDDQVLVACYLGEREGAIG